MRAAGLIGLVLLAGCGGERPKVVPPVAVAGVCDAAKAGAWIGRAVTPQIADAARVASGAKIARTVTPGMMVTMDYRDDRLNLTVDDKDVVTAIRCG